MELQLLLKIKKTNFTFYLRGKPFLLSVLFVVLSVSIFAQSGTPVMDKLAVKLSSLAPNMVPELVYIQTSKNIYETGEDLWFKAYLLDTHYLTPSKLSQTLYLQVVNEKTSNPVWQEKYEVQNGFANGHVYINDTLSEGDYLLEAFTSHSFFNDTSEFKAVRKITVKKDMGPRPSFTANFNKPYYNPEDTIKATISARSENNKPLYAEVEATLFEGDKKLEQAQSATNRKGEAKIAFALQRSGEGLRVVAHVNYEDKGKTLIFPVPYKKGSPIQFDTFPEGGNMVVGIPCRIAFKAMDIDGNPLDVAGTLFENNTPLHEFKSVHAGIGSFNFTPGAGNRYHIRLTEPTTDSTFLLPEIYPQGTTMQLAGHDKEYLNFMVLQGPEPVESAVYLRGQMRGQVYCMARGKLSGELKIKIPLKEFPHQGIAEFTLFDENLLPIAERLVFIHPDRKLYIKTELSKEKYETREKATLKIIITDENKQPVQANLGVSVYDKLYQKHNDPKNILAHCYLSEQLKGRIYDPAWYFDEKNDGRGDALDLLLLTQGWRKYVWDEENLKTHRETPYPVISDGTGGEVHYTKKLKQAPKGEQFVMAFKPGENKNLNLIASDAAGRFIVSPVHLKAWQGGDVYLKPMGSSDFEPRISLEDPFQQINETLKAMEIGYPLSSNTDTVKKEPRHSFVAGPNIIELDEVTIKEKAVKPFRDKYLGHLDSITKADLTSVWVCCHSYLENYKYGYSHECGNCGDSIRAKPIEGETYRVIRYEYVGREDGRKIVTDVYNTEFYYPKFTEAQLLKMNNLYRLKAYYGKREFYQPNYDKESESDVLPDTRNTLLWAPSVITDENGEATLEFFCSDINTGFVGKIEGVGGNGLLGSGDFEFIVRKTKPLKWED